VAVEEWEGEMLARIAGAVRFKEPLSFHTSLRIGGPADFFVMPQDLDDVCYTLAFAEQEDLPVTVIGGGNNMLVSDEPVPGVVVKLGGILGRAEFHGEEVAVGAGMSLSGLIREAASRNLGGLEFLSGIPASIGGALVANAGTRDGSIADICAAIYFLHRDGTLGEFRPVPHTAASFELPPGGILIGCRLRLVRRPMREIQKNIQQRMKLRKSFQPFALASAGYIWKNPPGHIAERLIESVGLRGKRLNGAEISTKCTNLIVNRGGAGPDDVLALMEMARHRVEKQFGIALVPEIRMIGLSSRFDAAEPAELLTARAS
jgi:UDP-N-acetylmuramate dehydrogenase